MFSKRLLKFIVDTGMFILLTATAVNGLLLGLVIPKGRAPAADRYFLGLHRHSWGDIHWYLSITFLGLVALHLLFNRQVILSMTRACAGKYRPHFWALLFGAWILVLFTGWLLVK